MIESNPTVFSATVFPPAFGPVTRSVWTGSPSSRVSGTTSLRSWDISRMGCRTSLSTSLASEIFAAHPFISRLYLACADKTSNWTKHLKLFLISNRFSRIFPVNSCRILSTSLFSRMRSFRISLFDSRISSGSIKSVAPVEDWSMTIPWILPAWPSFIGMTSRPSLMVKWSSWAWPSFTIDRRIDSSRWWLRLSDDRILLLKCFNSGDALSLISPCSEITRVISRSSSGNGIQELPYWWILGYFSLRSFR